MEVKWSASRSGSFFSRKAAPQCLWIGSWERPGPGMDSSEKRIDGTTVGYTVHVKVQRLRYPNPYYVELLLVKENCKLPRWHDIHRNFHENSSQANGRGPDAEHDDNFQQITLNITMRLTLMRLAAMLEQGETTVLRQRSCTTKLHTATYKSQSETRPA